MIIPSPISRYSPFNLKCFPNSIKARNKAYIKKVYLKAPYNTPLKSVSTRRSDEKGSGIGRLGYTYFNRLDTILRVPIKRNFTFIPKQTIVKLLMELTDGVTRGVLMSSINSTHTHIPHKHPLSPPCKRMDIYA